MKRFILEAIVDERHLWELMAILEQHRAEGILARPYGSNGTARKQTKQAKVSRKGPALNDVRAKVRAAALAAIERGEQFSTKGLSEQLGVNGNNLHQPVHALLKEGAIKRVGLGQYAAGRKAAAAIEANK